MVLSKALVSLSAILLACAPAAHAGCFEGDVFNQPESDMEFGHLHNNPTAPWAWAARDLTDEIKGDIKLTCSQVDGYAVPAGKSWERCADWGHYQQDDICMQYVISNPSEHCSCAYGFEIEIDVVSADTLAVTNRSVCR